MEHQEFKEKFLPLSTKLYRIAYAMLHNKESAEDAVQQCFLQLWSKRHELDQLKNHEAFAVTMLKHHTIDTLRSVHFNKSDSVEHIEIDALTVSDEGAIEARNEIECIKKVMKQLPENQRTVLLLHGIESCTFKEIEEITGLSAANIRTLLSRARTFIKTKMKSYETENR